MQKISLVNKKGGVAKTTTALVDMVGTFDILTGKEDINDAI